MQISYSKFRFYLAVVYYKLRIVFDCTSGRGRLLLAELLNIVNAIFHTDLGILKAGSIQKIETIFGKYLFINDYYGYRILSPAFERPDKEFLIAAIRGSLRRRKSVLFLDVGAYVGDYCIGVSHMLRNRRLTTVAFEPDRDYFNLCRKNITLNNTKNCKVYNFGLSDDSKSLRLLRFPTIPSSKELTYQFQKLDMLLSPSYFQKFDEIFVKIDVEGHEEDIFTGAQNLIKSGKKIRIMIEDCVNPSIIRYLQKNNWRFVTKITPYNSFWELN